MESEETRKRRNTEIEFALIAVKDAAMLYERYQSKGINALAATALKAMHKAQNDLYDAIGGMEDYKFDVEE